MKQDEAKEAIAKEWRAWAAKNNVTKAKGTDAMLFFTFLQKERSQLLNFRASGDKYQHVKSWLSRAGLVSD